MQAPFPLKNHCFLFVNEYYTTILPKINLFSIFVAKVRYGFCNKAVAFHDSIVLFKIYFMP